MSLFSNSDDFLSGLNASPAKAIERFAQTVKNVVHDAHDGVTSKTPVWSGENLANTQWSMDRPDPEVFPAQGDGNPGPTNSMPLGTEPRRAVNQAMADESLERLSFDPPFHEYVLQNNAPNAEGLEHGLLPGAPLRSRSPNGMFSVTLAEVAQRLGEGRYDD